MQTTTQKKESIYHMVEQLIACQENGNRDEVYRSCSSDPAFHRALRIHRHLKALEREILDEKSKARVSLGVDPASRQVVISIRHDNIRCRRVAYLSDREFSLLRQNRQVTNILKRCKSWQRVA